MITINATGDTTLHTAGKYCPEDILVKVPAGSGGGGGGSVETCTVTIECSSSTPNIVCGTIFVDGEMSTYIIANTRLDPMRTTVIENVVCGSTIAMYVVIPVPLVTLSGGLELTDTGNGCFVFRAPSVGGAAGAATISSNL